MLGLVLAHKSNQIDNHNRIKLATKRLLLIRTIYIVSKYFLLTLINLVAVFSSILFTFLFLFFCFSCFGVRKVILFIGFLERRKRKKNQIISFSYIVKSAYALKYSNKITGHGDIF